MFLDIPFGYNETFQQKKKKKSNLIQFDFIDPHHGKGMISATIMLTWDQRRLEFASRYKNLKLARARKEIVIFTKKTLITKKGRLLSSLSQMQSRFIS